MKKHLYKTFILVLALTVVSTALLSTFMPVRSLAAGEQYMIYWPNDAAKLTKLEQSIDDGSENGFGETFVGAKGGFFGNETTFTFDKQEDLGGDDYLGHYWYKFTYSCVKGNTGQSPPFSTYQSGGDHIEAGKYNKVLNAPADLATAHYTIEIQAAVPLNKDRGAGGSYWNSSSPNEWSTGITHWWYDGTKPVPKDGQATPARVHHDSNYSDGEFKTDTEQDPNFPNPPASCLVAPFGWSPGNSTKGTQQFNLKKYQKMSAAEKAQWDSGVKKGKTKAAATSAATASSGGKNESPSCESNGSKLGWLLCPVINMVADALNSIYSGLIQPLLKTNPLVLTPGSAESVDPNHTYEIWNNFRIYGNILLVIVLLIVVFGESIGGGLIDAYTAKKILPRLLIGAILINLSIYIVAFGLDVTNILGNGLQSLIQSPFQQAGQFKLNIFGTSPGFSDDALGIVGVVLGLVAIPAVWGPISFLLLFILVPTLIVMALIVGILLIRQGLILLLIFAAPIAFALWCLPNTEQYFKKWWDTLFRTLLIYPIVAVIFAMANVLSVTISNTTTSLKVFSGLLAVICLFAPLYLIPFAFQIAGGIMGTLGNLGKRVSAGGMGWAKNRRGNNAKANIEGMKNGTRFNSNGALARPFRRLNNATARVSGGASAGFGLGARGRAHLENVRAQNAMNAPKDPKLAALAGDANALAVLNRSDGTGRGGRRTARELQQLYGWSDEETNRAFHAARVAGFNPRNQEGSSGLSGKNPPTALRNGGAAGIQNHIAAVRQSAIDANNGDVSAGERAVFAFTQAAKESGNVDMSAASTAEAWQNATVGQHLSGKGGSLQTFSNQFTDVLNDPDNHTPEEVLLAATAVAEMDAQKSGATAENQETINNALFNTLGLDDTSPVSIPDQIAAKISTATGGRNFPAETIRKNYRAAAPPTVGGGPATGPAPTPPTPPPAPTPPTPPTPPPATGPAPTPPTPPTPPPATGPGPTRTRVDVLKDPKTRVHSTTSYYQEGPNKGKVKEMITFAENPEMGQTSRLSDAETQLVLGGIDPRDIQGEKGESSTIQQPTPGMDYAWREFKTPDGRTQRTLHEIMPNGVVTKTNVVLETGGTGFSTEYDPETKKHSIVETATGRVVADDVPVDWIGWEQGHPPISEGVAERLKEDTARRQQEEELKIDHSS
ncbi:MAG: hypothetical protein WCK80_02055 [bacterium]